MRTSCGACAGAAAAACWSWTWCSTVSGRGAGARLTREEVAALERLLRLGDNDLLDLVMGRAQAPDPGLADVLDKLRGA